MTSIIEFRLPEDLTISHVQSLQDKLESAIGDDAYDALEIEADGVQKVDTAGLQVLLVLANAARERHIKLSWVKPSENLCAAASTLGLESALNMEPA